MQNFPPWGKKKQQNKQDRTTKDLLLDVRILVLRRVRARGSLFRSFAPLLGSSTVSSLKSGFVERCARGVKVVNPREFSYIPLNWYSFFSFPDWRPVLHLINSQQNNRLVLDSPYGTLSFAEKRTENISLKCFSKQLAAVLVLYECVLKVSI